MLLQEIKYPENTIKVQSHKNQIIVNKQGFVLIQGRYTHRGFNRVKPEAIEEAYNIPNGVTFSR